MEKLIGVMVAAMLWVHEGAGQSTLKFVEDDFDFGKVSVLEDALSHSFDFVNTGSDSLGINDVSATCDCLVSEWPERWVQPGDTSRVVVSYFPSGRIGDFSKAVSVIDSKGQKVSLGVSGQIIYDEAELRHLSFGQGALYTKRQKINLGSIYAGQKKEISILVVNKGKEKIKFMTEDGQMASFISVRFDSEKLDAGEVSQFHISMDASGLNAGYRVDEISLVTNEEGSDSLKTYYLMSNILPEPNSTTNGGARISLDRDLHDFGLVKQGEILTSSFQLMNTGKDQLEVLKVQSNCSCVGVRLPKKRLESFESIELGVFFLTDDRVDNQYKSITLYTNDPDNPARVIYLKARVQP